jgi:hypothetical protein
MSRAVFHGTRPYAITGGMRRFRGANGHGTAVGGADFSQGGFGLTLIGTISILDRS